MSTKPSLTLESAEAERDRLAAAARAAGEIADALAAERLAAITERRQTWAAGVLSDSAVVAATLGEAEKAAGRAFREAAIAGDPRGAYFAWTDARNAVNVHHDRIVRAKGFLGEAQDGEYPIKDVPVYGAELDRALSSEASNRWADRQAAFQRELNSLDTVS